MPTHSVGLTLSMLAGAYPGGKMRALAKAAGMRYRFVQHVVSGEHEQLPADALRTLLVAFRACDETRDMVRGGFEELKRLWLLARLKRLEQATSKVRAQIAS